MSLLATKLHRPSLPPGRVARPHLLARLADGLAAGRQLTLISAPAGFGKSTCAAEWVAGLDRPVAWLALERADDDPLRFFSYLVAALQQVAAGPGASMQGALQAGQLPPTEALSAALIDDLLACGCPLLLALDDFQVIQAPAILAVLERLIANQPPNLHLAIITREDPPLPLARLRANNQLTEVRAADLLFSAAEAEQFLNRVMGLQVAPDDVAALIDKTEGWVAGLQLAALAMQSAPGGPGRSDPAAFIARLSGSHRYILSYLTEEVLSQQPEDVQRFLLQTAILDRLSGPLCDAVTGRADSAARLEGLLAGNLFLIPLDDERQWYRYHHLFGDLLRNLQHARDRKQALMLHHRASDWYAQAGLPGEAIRHALAAEDADLALELLETHATGLILQGYLHTVEGWLQAIPPAQRLNSPRTNLAFVWVYLIRGEIGRAGPYLERLAALFADPSAAAGDPALRSEWLSLQSFLHSTPDRAAESLALARQAVEIAPPEAGSTRGLAYHALASATLLQGDYAQVVALYQKAIAYSRAGAATVAELLCTIVLAQVALQHGQYHFAEEIAAQGIGRLTASGTLPPIGAVAYTVRGQIAHQWGQPDRAREAFQQAIHLAALGGYRDGEVVARAGLSRLHLHTGDRAAAAAEIDAAAGLMGAGGSAWALNEAISQQVRLALAEGRLADADAALRPHGFGFAGGLTTPPLAWNAPIPYELRLLVNSALRIAVARAQAGDDVLLQAGIELAGRQIDSARDAHYQPIALEALLIRARLHALAGDEAAARADCVQALWIAEPEGVVAAFTEEGPAIAGLLAALLAGPPTGGIPPGAIQRILDTLPAEQTPTVAATPAESALTEPLSGREREVLALIAGGCSNRDIAERLVLSPHTVKKHVSNLFGKLDVHSRTQAVALARELGLL